MDVRVGLWRKLSMELMLWTVVLEYRKVYNSSIQQEYQVHKEIGKYDPFNRKANTQ